MYINMCIYIYINITGRSETAPFNHLLGREWADLQYNLFQLQVSWLIGLTERWIRNHESNEGDPKSQLIPRGIFERLRQSGARTIVLPGRQRITSFNTSLGSQLVWNWFYHFEDTENKGLGWILSVCMDAKGCLEISADMYIQGQDNIGYIYIYTVNIQVRFWCRQGTQRQKDVWGRTQFHPDMYQMRCQPCQPWSTGRRGRRGEFVFVFTPSWLQSKVFCEWVQKKFHEVWNACAKAHPS